jgi:hypothetical protein
MRSGCEIDVSFAFATDTELEGQGSNFAVRAHHMDVLFRYKIGGEMDSGGEETATEPIAAFGRQH